MPVSQKRKRANLKKLERKSQMRHRPNPERWFYSFVPFKVSTGGAAPLIPLLTIELGGGPREVGLVNAVGSLSSMLGGLFWGKLSDRLNRRKVFLILGSGRRCRPFCSPSRTASLLWSLQTRSIPSS